MAKNESYGVIESIFFGVTNLPLTAHQEATVVAGEGIIGDRYYERSGTFSEQLKHNPKSEITFISVEEIDLFNQNNESTFGYHEFRRNVLTSGVDLNTLVGKEFQIGPAKFLGIEPCQPCGHLAKLVDEKVLPQMMDRAGLRASVLEDGQITSGERVTLV